MNYSKRRRRARENDHWVILSGTMYDGVAGVLAIQKAGGTTIVQEPMEAAFSGMPWAALEAHAANYRFPFKESAA